jgi:membrane dipeptidase
VNQQESADLPLVFDGHNDLLLRLHKVEDGRTESFFKGNGGHIDLPRARKGRFGGGFFAIFVPAETDNITPSLDITPASAGDDLPSPLSLPYTQQVAFSMVSLLLRLEEEAEGQLKVVKSATEIEECLRDNVIAAILHFEGAEMIDPELHALEMFYNAGLRSLGPVWSRPNAFGEGVPFRFPASPDTGPGLTEAGKELVRACNRLGIMLDLSHLNEKGFWDVAGITEAPLIATHSNVHAICPMTRNLTDRQLDAIKESDGMVGLNFGVRFVREDGERVLDTPLDAFVRHIDYLVERVGIDRVGFGSDFDGAVMSEHLDEVSKLPNLLRALSAHGYSDAELRKLAHENWVRVLKKTWSK